MSRKIMKKQQCNASTGIWTATATLLQNAFIHALTPKIDEHVTVEQVEKK
jgi:hypothetical protein